VGNPQHTPPVFALSPPVRGQNRYFELKFLNQTFRVASEGFKDHTPVEQLLISRRMKNLHALKVKISGNLTGYCFKAFKSCMGRVKACLSGGNCRVECAEHPAGARFFLRPPEFDLLTFLGRACTEGRAGEAGGTAAIARCGVFTDKLIQTVIPNASPEHLAIFYVGHTSIYQILSPVETGDHP